MKKKITELSAANQQHLWNYTENEKLETLHTAWRENNIILIFFSYSVLFRMTISKFKKFCFSLRGPISSSPLTRWYRDDFSFALLLSIRARDLHIILAILWDFSTVILKAERICDIDTRVKLRLDLFFKL